ncbi:MAG: ATP-binding protein [Desulfomonile sp.]|jgi:two-component system NtrC family sensor kinase|nr:ATP-binding protein [Deltaproteobacteria bacterium]
MENKDIHNEGYYKSLTRKIALVIILVSVTPLILTSVTLRHYFNVSYQEKVVDGIKVLIKKHKQNIDTFLNQKLSEVKVLARFYGFGPLADEAFLRDRLLILREEFGPSFVDLGVVDEQGTQVAYAGPFRLNQADYSTSEWFRQAIHSRDYISDVFAGIRGLPHFIVATTQEHKGKKWILRATVDFEEFNTLVEKIRIGDTGFAFILNKKGEFQTKPRYGVLPLKSPYITFLENEQLRAEDVALLELENDTGVEALHIMAPLKNGEWILAYQQNSSDAYAVMRQARRLGIVILLVGGCGIGVVAIVLAKRMVKRIAEADRQKEMMNEQMIEAGKFASVGELAAGIAHEINNPVAVMVEEAGWIEDLLKEEDLKRTDNLEEFERALNQIRIQGRRCKEITHKLLSFARKTDPTVKYVQLNELVEDVVALSEQRARYSGVKITMSLSENLPKVQASPSEIQQVLLNLVNNAVDATEKTGGNIDITTRIKGGFVVVAVSDDGPGIAKANLQKIFDPFYTTKPVGKGTGLGLSICYGIVKKMGGEIIVQSAKGLGATFHVHIPRTPGIESKPKHGLQIEQNDHDSRPI